MFALERWLEHHPPPPTLVSVVLPTYDRGALLAEAVASVQAQNHPRWELIVVDDGGVEETRRILDAVEDPRVRSVVSGGVGPPGARNRGLDDARGAVVAYLDDDNVMLPGWLRAVAWAFDRHPDVDVLYGARIVEDASMYGSTSPLPRMLLSEFDRARLERENYTDANVLAHRARIPGARWDPDLSGVSDWDLMLRLTADKPALTLPAVAVLYRTRAPGKHSASEQFQRNYATLLERIGRGAASGP